MTGVDAPTLLADITSRDSMRIWSSASAIIRLRDPPALDALASHLPEIEDRTAGVDLGGRLILNAVHLAFALKKLRYWQARAGCLCRLYPDYLLYSPVKEAEAGNVRIDDTVYDRQWVDAYVCTCAVCGTRYRVEEREYHYSWWGWRAMDSPMPPTRT